ncbi:hypothetical protein ARMGADRAFT_304105 [Armillaria gallica]|uniref:Uncharacterized protein n=1 Tax=Armillaria gallica TaxID=47427 RepID=A0A2H3DP66_ARMGA|nr:hypothetical protein ARMGADRAFT_304105 [Armillaria gallica]
MARYFQDYIKPSLFAGQPSCGHYGLGIIEFRCFFRGASGVFMVERYAIHDPDRSEHLLLVPLDDDEVVALLDLHIFGPRRGLLDRRCSECLHLINNGASYPTSSAWTVPTAALLTYTSASIAQAFFCYRYWTLTRNKWITGCIIFLITAHMLCNLVSNIYILAHPSDTISFIPLMITNAAMCATTDITIAGSLVWACSHIQSPYTHIRNILRRVMIQAMTCGFTTAIFTTLMIVFLFTAWNACFTIFASLGHIYSLTVLITVMLLKVMGRSDPSSFRIDDDGGSEPVTLTPVGDIRFGHTSDAEAGKTQTSSDKQSESTRDSMHPRVETLAKACVHTV